MDGPKVYLSLRTLIKISGESEMEWCHFCYSFHVVTFDWMPDSGANSVDQKSFEKAAFRQKKLRKK